MFRTAACVFIPLVMVGVAGAVDVTSCGQVIPGREPVVLQVDLDSCPSDSPAVVLPRRSRLQLNGHAVRSGSIGVLCDQACNVYGPGEIGGAMGSGIEVGVSGDPKRVSVRDVEIHSNGGSGIWVKHTEGNRDRVKLERVNLHGNDLSGMQSSAKLRARDLTVRDNGSGGVGADGFNLRSATIENNDGPGLLASGARRGTLVDCSIQGNVYNATVSIPFDVVVSIAPRMRDSTCGTSRDYADGSYSPLSPTLGFCAND